MQAPDYNDWFEYHDLYDFSKLSKSVQLFSWVELAILGPFSTKAKMQS